MRRVCPPADPAWSETGLLNFAHAARHLRPVPLLFRAETFCSIPLNKSSFALPIVSLEWLRPFALCDKWSGARLWLPANITQNQSTSSFSFRNRLAYSPQVSLMKWSACLKGSSSDPRKVQPDLCNDFGTSSADSAVCPPPNFRWKVRVAMSLRSRSTGGLVWKGRTGKRR